MIERLLLFLSIFFCSRVHSQQYFPLIADSARWHVFWSNGTGSFTDIFKTTIDTVIGNLTYKKVTHTSWLSSNDLFLREDTAQKKAWYLDPDSTGEKILYDFSLQQGDSIYLEFGPQWMGPILGTGWYVVDSIRNTNISAGIRRKFFLYSRSNPPVWFTSQSQSVPPALIWIEGVGASIHPFYPLQSWLTPSSWWSVNCTDYSSDVTCAFQNGSRQYHNTCYDNYMTPQYMSYIQDSCTWFIGDAVPEWKSDVTDIIISPNPSNGKFTLSFSAPKSFEGRIMVRDVLGKTRSNYFSGKIPVGKHLYDLDLDLPQGVYFLQVGSGDAMLCRKIVVTK
ncbi:MAG TPA: T9SS type A sorting domain-containing protein [Bacteroidia bacterium]|jgi:hypothetical protein